MTTSSRREVMEARLQAVRAYESLDPRGEADHLREAFVKSSSQEANKWDSKRLYLLHSYIATIKAALERDGRNALLFVTKEDKQFLKRISQSLTELSLYRALATDLWGTIALSNLEYDEQAQSARSVIKICDEASEMEKQRLILHTESTYGSLIDETRKANDGQLAFMRNIFCMVTSHTKCTQEGAQPEQPSVIGGDKCKMCSTTYEDLGVAMLDCCQRCQLTYYCSRDCQRKDWKDHKKVCRKPGEFQVGDKALLADPNHDGPGKFGDMVRILASAPDDPDQLNPQSWVVNVEMDRDDRPRESFIVQSKYLRRLRPEMWDTMGAKESTELVKLLRSCKEAEAAEAAGTLSSSEAEEAVKAAQERFDSFIDAERRRKDFESRICDAHRTLVVAQEKAKGLDLEEAAKLFDSERVKDAIQLMKYVARNYGGPQEEGVYQQLEEMESLASRVPTLVEQIAETADRGDRDGEIESTETVTSMEDLD